MNGSTLSLLVVTLLSLELIVQLGFVTAQRSEEEQELGSDGRDRIYVACLYMLQGPQNGTTDS